MDPRHLKDKEYDISLTMNYCIIISTEKVSSIHKFILKTQQILGSHELKGQDHFDNARPKIIELNYSFPEFVPACKKSVYFICSFFKCSQF